MNRTKKIAWLLCVVVCLCLCLVACKDQPQPTSTATQPQDAIYTIRVSTPSGVLPKNLTIYVYEDASKAELVDLGPLNDKGEFTFTDKVSDQYIAVIEGMPEEGYDLQETYAITGTTTEIVLTSSVVQGKEPTDKVYQLGDVMRDFTVTTTDGVTLKLSELLKEKDAVVLNFWYTKCQPCKNEFPLIQEAYEMFGDEVEVIAMNSMRGETEGQVAQFKMENGLTFPMAKVDSSWEAAMRVTGYPTTVVIDRYGVICLMHVGGVTDENLFAGVFSHFAADDYQQKLIKDIEELNTFEFPVGTDNNPFETYGSAESFQVTVEPQSEYHVLVFRADNVTVRIENPNVYVLYMDQRYEPDANGVIELLLSAPDAKSGAKLVIGNTSDVAMTVEAVLSTGEGVPQGTLTNPYLLELGELIANIEEGNELGVYYTITAAQNGFLKVAVLQATEDVSYEVQLFNLNTMAQRNLTEEELVDENGLRYVQVAVSAGDVIRVGFMTIPDGSGNYPAAQIQALVTESEQAESITYTVTFKDEEGNPMPGVSISLTIDGVLTTLVSDENGQIIMNLAPNNYSIKVEVPEGYVAETTQYLLTASNPNRDITLSVYVAKEVIYIVNVVDDEGNPISDVAVAIGDRFARTGEDGIVRFVLIEGSYSATVVPPAGYLADSTSYAFGTKTTLTIVLKKDNAAATQTEYKVTVLDCNGNPYTNVLVSFAGTSVVQSVNASGVATAVLEKGTYQIVLLFSSGNEMGYETATAKVTATYTSVVIEVAPYADGAFEVVYLEESETSGRYMNLGGSFVELTSGGLTYFLFTPTETGIYQITTTNADAKVENWNHTDYTVHMDHSVENNVLTLEVNAVGNTYVFAINAGKDVDSTIVKIARTGSVGQETEVEVFQGTMMPTVPYKFTLAEGQKLNFLDLTAEHTLVKDADGFYHLDSVDGALVLVDLDATRYGVNIKELVDKGAMLKYEYDANGNPVKRIDYTDCMVSYVNNRDEKLGVYALTDDLMTMLKAHGETAGWYDSSSAGYLFGNETGLNAESLWMFLLCVAG